MEVELLAIIRRHCDRLIARHQANLRAGHYIRQRFRKRSGKAAGKPRTTCPARWALDRHFDLYYVRRRARGIAHGLALAMRGGAYRPKPAIVFDVPKPAGGKRAITIFTIPDAAVSTWLLRQLSRRCHPYLSPHAYAYRPDRTGHHAIEHLARWLRQRPRSYYVHFDFRRYFDSIPHDYIVDLLRTACRIPASLLALVQSFLRHERARVTDYRAGNFSRSTCGVPQGASISLLLANVAALPLDRELERMDIAFARYSDDIAALTDSYSTAGRVVERCLAYSRDSGIELNHERAPGIWLVSMERDAEIRRAEGVQFLGHLVTPTGVTLPSRTLVRIKRRVATIIYRHLLYYPKKFGIPRARLARGARDWDLLGCVCALRRYIYGRTTEAELRGVLLGEARPRRRVLSALSYFPLVDDSSPFRLLDGWLLNVLGRALRARRIFARKVDPGYAAPRPQELIDGSWYGHTEPIDARLPSFVRAWHYVRRSVRLFEYKDFPAPYYSS